MAKYVELTSNSVVQPWSEVADLLRDTDPEFAEYIDGLVYKYSDTHDLIIPHMRKHAKYRTVLLKDILPALRKVEYTLNYSEFRKLKDFEIWDPLQCQDRRNFPLRVLATDRYRAGFADTILSHQRELGEVS